MRTHFLSALQNQPFLTLYSGLLTLVFVLTTLSGFSARRSTTFETLTVQRLNVIEPDGTLRLVVSNKARFPGLILHRQERPNPDRQSAGLLFFNDEGTENGGVMFGGKKASGSPATSYGHLSFDEYDKDQSFTIDTSEEGEQHQAGLAVNDNPDYPVVELLDQLDRVKGLSVAQQRTEMQRFYAHHRRAQRRLYLGREADHSVGLSLQDAQGRKRLELQVGAEGSAFLRFLDESGKIVTELPPQNK